jgi:hypothetical protein
MAESKVIFHMKLAKLAWATYSNQVQGVTSARA